MSDDARLVVVAIVAGALLWLAGVVSMSKRPVDAPATTVPSSAAVSGGSSDAGGILAPAAVGYAIGKASSRRSGRRR